MRPPPVGVAATSRSKKRPETTQKEKNTTSGRERRAANRRRGHQGARLPTGTIDLVTNQASGTVPMKGAAGALCNPKADVPPTKPRMARDSMDIHATTSRRLGTTLVGMLHDKRTEGGTQGGNLGGCVLERVLAGFHLVKRRLPPRGGGAK